MAFTQEVSPPHAVRSEPIKKPVRPRIGFISGRGIERAFVVLLYLTLLALVVLSVVGTFYGLAYETAPLWTPRQVIADIRANVDRLWVAIAIQLFLTLSQYGGRQFARRDRRWWVLYLVTLSISVYYNVQAYWTPLNELMLWPVAAAIILAGDVLPEFIAIRQE